MKLLKLRGRPITWILSCTLMSACLEPYETALTKRDYGILVVDGFFVPNDTTKIKLSRTTTIDTAGAGTRVNDAVVQIENESGSALVLKNKGNGIYTCPPVNVDIQSNYRLSIQTSGGTSYTSDYVSVESTHQLDSITWSEEQEIADVIAFQIYSHDPTNSTRYYYWSYDETWEYNSKDISIYYFQDGKLLPRSSSTELYYCYNTISNPNYFLGNTSTLGEDKVYDFRLIQFLQSDIKFYYGYSMLVKQYGLSESAYSYWQITKKNSENLGTLFDPLPNQPVSNLHSLNSASSVIGYFGASMVQIKRVFFKRQALKGPNKYGPNGYESCIREFLPVEEMDYEHLKDRLIIEPVFDKITFLLTGYQVSLKECIDCRYHGGTLTRPDYWQ